VGQGTGAQARDTAAQTADDVITTELVRNALAIAVEEASVVVVRSSHSTFIQEGADACAAVLDTAGRLVAQSTATSLMHGSSIRSSFPFLIEEVPLDAMGPGDVFVMNDPYRGGIHANDLIVLRPVFDGDDIVFFTSTLIHVADLGGNAAGGLAALATDTFAEGLLVPPVALYRGGEIVRDVAQILRSNSRAPDQVMGDINALVAGANVAANRLGELIDRFGQSRIATVVDQHIAYTEGRMRDELRLLPEGTYHGSFTIESDGLDADRTFTVRVAVTVADGSITLDFTGTDPQSRGAINSSFSQTLSGVIFAVRCFVDPSIPMNDGCFIPVETILPLGSIVSPEAPAACGGRVVTVFAVLEAIVQALSQARPDHAVASSGLVHVFTLASAPDAPEPWLTLLYELGGIGARNGSDGHDATGAFFLGGRSVIPQVEPLEGRLPILVRRVSVREDSGGAGQWRGGLGSRLEIEMLEDATATVRGDRMIMPPPGVRGGHSGNGGTNAVDRADGTHEALKPKHANISLKKGDVLVVSTSGGGGLGSPLDRDPERVLRDVREKLVSQETAARDYGVVIADGAVDPAATDEARTGLRSALTSGASS
jgi:N-methylhydantoinase B